LSAAGRFDPHLDAFTATRLDELTDLVWRAASRILGIKAAHSGAKLKSDHSPVCDADVKAEAVIIEGLSRLFPHLPVVSEEAFASTPPTELGDTFALVDPLDGTREFLGGRAEYTVNIAILVRGTPVVGLIAAPALRTIWRGVLGRGAERLRLPPGGGPSQAVEVKTIRSRPRPTDGMVIAVSRSHFDPSSAALLSQFKIADQIVCGSSLKFCRLAEGSADFYPRLAPVREWDIAAGQAVLTAAGGMMMAPGGGSIAYGGALNGFHVPGFIAFGDPCDCQRIALLASKACQAGHPNELNR
jgi:3'(2'), 5'-bisphosphate nucleotidase